MAEGRQEVATGRRVVDDPHEQEPSQAYEQGPEDIDGDPKLRFKDAPVEHGEGPRRPVAEGAHTHGQ